MSDGKFSIPRASIPDNWAVCRVDEAGTVQLGRQRSPKDHTGPHMRPYLRAANVFEDRIDISDVKEMNFTPKEFENFRLREGDILLNEGQSLELVGRPAMFRGEIAGCCFQNTLVRYVPAQILDGQFALKLFQHYMWNGRFQKIARWTTNIAHLGASRFAELEIPLPPLAEQKRIVAKIEELFSELEAGEESLRVARRQLGVYRQSLLKQAFESKLTARWRTQNPAKDSAWSPTTVGQVGRIETGTTPPTENQANYGGDLPFFKPTDLEQGRYVKTARSHLSTAGQQSARVLPAGTVLVTCIGATIGKTGLAQLACATNQQINSITPAEDIAPEFAYFQVISPQFQEQIKTNASSTTLPILNKSKFSALTFVRCSLPEQQEIVRVLDEQFEGIERNEREIDGALRLSEALRQAILQKAFTGRLVPQHPAAEPASALLTRLRAERATGPG